MISQNLNRFSIDRGGRRRIKDRRFRVTAMDVPERRTGLRRRSGWDRRCLQVAFFTGTNRRKRGL